MPFLPATLLLTALAMVVFTTVPLRLAAGVGLLAAGFLIGMLANRGGLFPEPGWIGVVVIGAAAASFHPGRGRHIAACAAGVLAFNLMPLLTLQGAPQWSAFVAVVAVLALAIHASRRHAGFSSPALHAEAMVLVLVIAVIVASAPEIASGWQAATALNASAINRPGADASVVIPVQLTLLCATPLLLGGFYSWWRRHRAC